jgi:hypothetical protein
MSNTKPVWRLSLTDDEYNALQYIADRYSSAAVLTDGAGWAEHDDGWDAAIPEGVMWGYVAALHCLEDFDAPPPPFPPMAGGTLASKLRDLVESFPTDLPFR